MFDFDFLLIDRIQKIQSINNLYDLENKSYISFSGGKDSTVLSKLIDIALPNNKIPRVFCNTGIEYKEVVNFVKSLQQQDKRIVIIQPKENIKSILNNYGYPFKSKEHSQKLKLYQRSGETKTILNYLGKGDKKSFLCPTSLIYNFSPSFKLKCSDDCCKKLKKEPCENYSKENNKPISLTGMRNSEGGLRQSVKNCTVFLDKNCKSLHKFHPLLPLDKNFINEFIRKYNIQLCKLYYSPYNFVRTGCKGCPFNVELQKQLDILKQYFPSEYKQCEYIWAPVYSEYRRISYRLKNQQTFDF